MEPSITYQNKREAVALCSLIQRGEYARIRDYRRGTDIVRKLLLSISYKSELRRYMRNYPRVYEVYEMYNGHMIKWLRVGDIGPFEIYSIRAVNEPYHSRHIEVNSQGYKNRIRKYEEEGRRNGSN